MGKAGETGGKFLSVAKVWYNGMTCAGDARRRKG